MKFLFALLATIAFFSARAIESKDSIESLSISQKIEHMKSTEYPYSSDDLQRFNKLIATINTSEATSSEKIYIYLYRGYLALIERDNDLAIESYLEAVYYAEETEEYREAYKARLTLIVLLNREGFYKEAKTEASKAVNDWEKSRDVEPLQKWNLNSVLYNSAMTSFYMKDYAEALDLFTKALVSGHKTVGSSQYIGLCYLENGQLTEAIKFFSKLPADSASNLLLTNHNLGVAYRRSNDMGLAEKYLSKALEIDSTYFPSLQEMGDMHLALNKTRAREYLSRAITYYNNPDFKDEYMNVFISMQKCDPTGSYYLRYQEEVTKSKESEAEGKIRYAKLNHKISIAQNEKIKKHKDELADTWIWVVAFFCLGGITGFAFYKVYKRQEREKEELQNAQAAVLAEVENIQRS